MQRFWTWLTVPGLLLAGGSFVMAEDLVRPSADSCATRLLQDESFQTRRMPPHLRFEQGLGDPACAAETNADAWPAPEPPWLQDDFATQPCPPSDGAPPFLGGAPRGTCGCRAGSDTQPGGPPCAPGTPAEQRLGPRRGGPGPTGAAAAFALSRPQFCRPQDGRDPRSGRAPFPGARREINGKTAVVNAAGGYISGTVTDAGTSSPLEDVEVVIYDCTGSSVTYAYTDISGVYTTPAVSAGTYYARTMNYQGYIDELYNDISCPFGSCTVTSGTAISVASGSTTTGIDFGLVPGGRISGTVTDGVTSLPLSGVDVAVYDSSGNQLTYGYTDASGVYTSYTGLPSGTYYAVTYNSQGYIDELYNNIPCPGGGCTVTSGTAISVTAGSTTTGRDFALAPGGRINGTVTDAGTSLALAGVYVDIYDSAGNRLTYGYTDGSGVYTSFTGLPSGTYYALTSNSNGYIDKLYNNISCPLGTCTVTSGTAITVTAGTTTTGKDFGLAPGGRISGTVTDANTSLALAGVYVYIYSSAGSFVTTGYTNSSGVYTTSRGLPSGTYYARTYNYQGYIDELYDNISCPGGCTVTGGTAISVTVGVTTPGIDFGLVAGGRVSGTVTDFGTGLPLGGVSVNIYNSAGNSVAYGSTDCSGFYTTRTGLPSGTYYARTSNSSGYLDELYNNIPCPFGGCTATSGTPISVTAGSTTPGIDFALARGGRISGTVTDAATSMPLANVEVDIYNSAGNGVTYGHTDSSGAYRTYTGLPSGTYYALTYNSQGYLDELYNNIPCPGGTCMRTSGTAISVTAGSTATGIDFALARGGRISGTVTDAATSMPLANVEVDIYNSAGNGVTYGYTDSSGAYTSFAGLPSGTYHASTSNSKGYIDELYDNIPCPGGECTVASGTAINVTAGSTAAGINFALAPGGRISGTVTDGATSLPLASVYVLFYDSSGSQLTSASTNSSGVYTTTMGLPSGTYYARTSNALGYIDELYNDISCPSYCTVTGGTAISVTMGSTTTGINFALAAGGRISGTVTDAATSMPLANVEVDVYNSTGSYVTYGTTNSSGIYTSRAGLPTGTYYARTYNSQGYVNELYSDISCPTYCTVTSGTPISVTAGSTTTGIDFGLAAGGRISGTVTDAATSLPLANVGVDMYNAAGSYVTYGTTNSSGAYTSSAGLPSGTYYVVTSNYRGYIDELYNNIPCPGGTCMLTSGTPITVTLGATTSGINFALARGGQISGTVTDAVTGLPLYDVEVALYDSAGSPMAYAYTDRSGAYTTYAGVPSGTYYARTWNWQEYFDELYDNRPCTAGACKVTSGTPISVTAGATTTGINFRLEPNPSLEFYTVTPCRAVDTRNPAGPLGGPALVAGTARTFTIAGTCGIPATARAVSANITVTQPSTQGNVRLYPAGASVPLVSTINYVAGVTRANNAVVKLNASGQTSVIASPSGTVHFILDVNGYFQ